MDTTQIAYTGQFSVEERRAMTAQMLQELRKVKKMSQKEVAAYLGIPATTYNTYESGRTEPPIEILVRLSHLYSTPVDVIVQRDRTFRTADDVTQQLEAYRAELAELDREIKEKGAASPEILALRDTLEKFVDALLLYSKKPDVKNVLEQPLKD